ncbi:hypothetical protein ABGT15_04415 [Flavobacterium enshiense]|uniref:hypothetical protein n=1 Tax=Flavobacterium enshiense TaxID=1341165 RepID=UPI00345D25A8
MKQQRLKLFGLCFVLSLFLFYSCSEDFDTHEHNQTKDEIRVKPISFIDIIDNQKVVEKLTNPKSRFKLNNNGRVINDTINNFTVDTNYGIFIAEGNYHSYTFKINRPNGSNYLLENIVISKKNESEYETLLYQYNITEEELEKIDNGLFVDLKGKIDKILLENSITISDLTGKYYFNGNCYEDSPVYIAGQTCQGTGSENHTFEEVQSGQYCSQFGSIYGPLPGYWTWQSSIVSCDDGGSGGSTGGGTSSGSSGTGGGTPNSGSTTTTPVNRCLNCPEITDNQDHCESLYKLTDVSHANLLGKFNILMNRVTNGTDQGKEFGYSFKKNDSGYSNPDIPNSTGNNLDVPTGRNDPSIYGAVHSHPSHLMPMFSFSDLAKLAELYRHAKPEYRSEVVFALVCETGIYTIKVNDLVKLTNKLQAVINNADGTTFEEKLDNANILINSRTEKHKGFGNDFELGFLKTLQEFDIPISLSKYNLLTNNWENLSIPPSGQPNAGRKVASPCLNVN